jgi:two-component system chemotaxis sensor kinase CheA
MARDPYKYFRIEARDLLDQFAKGVLDLEKEGGGALVQRLLRVAHTLKGAARVVKQTGIADRAHAVEDLLVPWRDRAGPLPRGAIDALLAELDQAETLLTALAPAEDAAAAAGPSPLVDEPVRSVRAEIGEVDTLLDGLAESHALLAGLRGAGVAMEQSRHLSDLLVAQLAPRPGTPQAGPQKQLFTLADDLRRKLSGFDTLLDQTVGQMDRELVQLRENAEQLRLAAAENLLTVLERAARDGARQLGRQVDFDGIGGDIRLDAPVLETMQRALVQILRNAIAHGIESPDERRRLGKPERGQIRVRVARTGRTVTFECSDDGRGIDFEAIRRAAKTPHASDDETIGLLLRGGLSTSERVTEAAGRGVGLDVVRDVAEALGGTVKVTSEQGRGTAFVLTVPPSLSAVDALLIEAGGIAAGIPLGSVRCCLRLEPTDFADTGLGLAISYANKAIPFLPLADLLALPRGPGELRWTAVIVESPDGLAALGVDRLLGTPRVVVHPLPADAPADEIVAGASLDAEGNPLLMLDPERLVAGVGRAAGSLPAEAKPKPPILVIDDSLTTQMLQRSILEAAGYRVDVAGSAEIGLEMAKARDYGLFLVDVEMPGMDGFGFIERIRSDPVLYRVPAILVTSRAAPEDLARGREVGAQGYMIKSAFDQRELLSMIKRLTE